VVASRGDLWWADLGQPEGSTPGFRHPVVVISDDAFNRSGIRTVVCAVVTSNVSLARAPGNVFLPKGAAGLTKDSVVNVTQILTVDKRLLAKQVGRLDAFDLAALDAGLRRSLALT
jgi:mRNA interferase MazF